MVDLLSAVVVSGAEGSGTFVASLSNNDGVDEQTSPPSPAGDTDADGTTVEAAEFEPVADPARRPGQPGRAGRPTSS